MKSRVLFLEGSPRQKRLDKRNSIAACMKAAGKEKLLRERSLNLMSRKIRRNDTVRENWTHARAKELQLNRMHRGAYRLVEPLPYVWIMP